MPAAPTGSKCRPTALRVLKGSSGKLFGHARGSAGTCQAAVTVGDEDVTGIVLEVPPLFEVSGEIEIVDSAAKPLDTEPPGMCVVFRYSEHGKMMIGLKGGSTFAVTLGEGDY
jgi:hypothetical protein